MDANHDALEIGRMFGHTEPKPPPLELLRGSVSYEFTLPATNYLDVHRQDIVKEIEPKVKAFEAEHLKQHGSLPKPCRTEHLRKPVHEKYEALHCRSARKYRLWTRSERLLDLLRTRGMMPAVDQDRLNGALGVFAHKVDVDGLPETDPTSLAYSGGRDPHTRPKLSPNVFFEITRPELVGRYGLPFYTVYAQETAKGTCVGGQPPPSSERIIGINSAFWGAFLGGDPRLSHDVVFYLPDQQFYFYDTVMGCYVPTSEAKLLLSLSLALQEIATGQDVATATMILEKFRTKKVFDDVIAKAKALLASDAGFFMAPNAKPRWEADQETGTKAGVAFVREWVEQADGEVVTVTECVERFRQSSADTVTTTGVLRDQLRCAIREVYGKGMRNDLVLPDGVGAKGWKDFKLRQASPTSDRILDEQTSFVRESGRSDVDLNISPEPIKHMELALSG